MKFRKVNGKKEWKAKNGCRIYLNFWNTQYVVNKGTFFEFVDSLEEAKKIAETDFRFQ